NLNRIDVKLDDKDQTLLLLLLCSLSPCFNHFRDTMIYGRETLSIEDVKANMQSNVKIDGELTPNGKDGHGVGLVARERPTDRGPKNDKNRPRSNSKHRNLIYDTKSQKEKEKFIEVSIAEVESDSDLLLAVDDKNSYTDEWVLDSGCSYHMCPRKD
ncbi:UBN2_2 domain-containing protein, partial [Cephalotus follicularis]